MLWINNIPVDFSKFPNGETHVKQESFAKSAMSKGIVIDFKYEDDSDLIKLMFVKRHLDIINPSAYKELYIQYMPYSRMDRSENGSVFTLAHTAEFINLLDFNSILINEPHSGESTNLIHNSSSILTSIDFLKLAKDKLEFDEEKDFIVLPDKGAYERYESRMNLIGKNILIGNKKRDFDSGRITSLTIEMPDELKTGGKKAIILDDLSSRGGTFIMASKALKEHGIEQVALVVGHAEDAIYDGDLLEHVDHIFTSDSILKTDKHWANIKHADKVHASSAMSVNYKKEMYQ